MIIYGWGKVTRKFFGVVAKKQCSMCNQITNWQLCIMRTWFTLFFIPVIPYKKVYCLCCSNCKSYIQLDKEQFEEIKKTMESGEEEAYKYAGKTPTQIAYLKAQEEAKNKEMNN